MSPRFFLFYPSLLTFLPTDNPRPFLCCFESFFRTRHIRGNTYIGKREGFRLLQGSSVLPTEGALARQPGPTWRSKVEIGRISPWTMANGWAFQANGSATLLAPSTLIQDPWPSMFALPNSRSWPYKVGVQFVAYYSVQTRAMLLCY